MIPSAAVFAAAIEDAEGFPITAMPISPSELFAPRGARHSGGDLMKIAGENILHAPVEQVWDALLDPAVLVAPSPAASGWRRPGRTPTHDRHRRRRRDQGHLRRHVRALGPAAGTTSLVMRLAGRRAPRARSARRSTSRFADDGDGTTRSPTTPTPSSAA